MFWDIPLQDYCNGISRDISLWYIPVILGIHRDNQGYQADTSALISGISRDIPVSAFLDRVIPGYPHVCMLKIPDSRNLNAQIERPAIWISSWKLYFSSAAAAWLGSRQALHGTLAWRRIATLTGRRRGSASGLRSDWRVCKGDEFNKAAPGRHSCASSRGEWCPPR